MADTPKALHPVKVAGQIVPAGGEIDPEKVGPIRLQRLIAKGRVTGSVPLLANRAHFTSGRPDLDLPDDADEA